LFVFALVTWSLAGGFFPQQYPNWDTSTYWIVAAIASILLFVSVLIHELAHSLVAKNEGMPVRSITLFIFGGVSNIEKEATSPRDEFLMAFVGPASSAVIGIVTAGLWAISSGMDESIQAILLYLTVINLVLAVFNLLPAFPLDGGRVFRAIVWWTTNDLTQATRIASAVGQGFAYLMIIGGIYWTFTGNIISGLWLVFIGWFLNNAAESGFRQMLVQKTISGVRVRDMMTEQVETVSADLTIQELIDRYILPHNLRALPVVENEQIIA
jgi:Zn-dependent protease